jgi:hypothetical protein
MEGRGKKKDSTQEGTKKLRGGGETVMKEGEDELTETAKEK